MKVNATIINMPKSKFQTTEFEDWYAKIIEQWGGSDYKLSKDSLIGEIEKLDSNSDIKVYEHGIVVPYVREAIIGNDSRYDEDFEETPVETAKMYMLDNGEVYYIHEGYEYPSSYGLSNVPISGKEFNISDTTDFLKDKLGKEYMKKNDTNESKGFIKSTIDKQKKNLVDKKKDAIIAGVKKAIKEGNYSERIESFNPNTNTIVEQSKHKLV